MKRFEPRKPNDDECLAEGIRLQNEKLARCVEFIEQVAASCSSVCAEVFRDEARELLRELHHTPIPTNETLEAIHDIETGNTKKARSGRDILFDMKSGK